jgi:hypothetical protein
MKKLIKQIGIIFLFISALILCQGCSVYKKAPITIEEAVTAGYSVKVRTIDSKTATYHHIELKEGQYFGVKHVDREQIFVPLKKGEINSIQQKDKARSTAGNATIVLPIVVVVLVLTGVIVVI